MTEATGDRRSLPPALVGCLLVAFGVALYANSLGNGYAIDDQLIVENNPLTSRGLAAIPEILTTNYLYQEGRGASYRAVPRVSYAVEYELFGPSPRIHHLGNVLIHAATGVVVWRWVALLFPAAPAALSVAVALLFLAHPVHTEVVNNLKSRDELLAFFFGALSAIAFLRFGARGTWRWLAVGTLTFALALCSKESAQHFVGVALLGMYFRSGWRPRRLGAALAGLLAVTALYWAFVSLFLNRDYALWMASAHQDFPFVEHPLLFVDDPSVRYGTALYSLGYYLRLFVWPHPLSFFYGYGAIPLVGLDDPRVWAAGAVLTALSLFALASLWRPTIPGFAVAYLLGTLLAFSNLLVPMSGIVGERFAYGASLGFCLLVGWGLTLRPGRAALAAGLAILAVWSALTWQRNPVWESRRTLAEHDVRSFPDAAVIRGVLIGLDVADARQATDPAERAARVADAREQLAALERIHPPYAARAALARGTLDLHLSDRPAAAVDELYRALALASDAPAGPASERGIDVERWRVHLELALALARVGRADDARIHLGSAILEWNRVASGDGPRAERARRDEAELHAGVGRVRAGIDAAGAEDDAR